MKKALAINALPLALLFGAAFQSPNSVPEQLTALQAQISGLTSQISSLETQVASFLRRAEYDVVVPINEMRDQIL